MYESRTQPIQDGFDAFIRSSYTRFSFSSPNTSRCIIPTKLSRLGWQTICLSCWRGLPDLLRLRLQYGRRSLNTTHSISSIRSGLCCELLWRHILPCLYSLQSSSRCWSKNVHKRHCITSRYFKESSLECCRCSGCADIYDSTSRLLWLPDHQQSSVHRWHWQHIQLKMRYEHYWRNKGPIPTILQSK